LHTGKVSFACYLAFAGATKRAFKDVRRKSCVAVGTAKLARVSSKVRFTYPGALIKRSKRLHDGRQKDGWEVEYMENTAFQQTEHISQFE